MKATLHSKCLIKGSLYLTRGFLAGTGRTKTTRWNGWPRKLYVDLDDFDVEKWEGVVKAARHMLSSWNQTNFLLEIHQIHVTNLQQSLEESVMLGHKMQRRCRRTSILSTKYVWNWDMHQQWQWWIHLSKNQTQETTPFSKRGRSYETFTIYYLVSDHISHDVAMDERIDYGS